jgi:hypothetical protein
MMAEGKIIVPPHYVCNTYKEHLNKMKLGNKWSRMKR